MPAVRLPELREKLRLLYAYTGLNQSLLGERIGRAVGTVSGYVNGTETTHPGCVPNEVLDDLVAILSEHFRGAVDTDTARQLWLGPFAAFARAFTEKRAVRFLDLVREAPCKRMLTYLPGGVDEPRSIAFACELGEEESGVIAANVGDRFAFKFEGLANAHIVLLVETVLGIHLAAPGPRSPSRLDAAGHALLPHFPDTYWFEEPKGRHRFLGFSIEAPAALSIAQAAGRIRPLPDDELDSFAAELGDGTRVQSWFMDIVTIDVR